MSTVHECETKADNAEPQSGDVARDPGLPRPGDLVAGKYRIERLLGRGGMGAVFLAEHELLRQRVALKLMLSGVASNPLAVPRFLNEARAAARIGGEHVARVLDVGTLKGAGLYIVLEYLEGADLGRLLDARHAFPAGEAVDFVLQALEGLAHVHALGIVHRDFKPSNLFLTRRPDGTPVVKVLDFGVSKASTETGHSDADITGWLEALGTPPYASPEQLCDSRSVDARSDIWSAGVVLYELLSGSVPIGGASPAERIAATLGHALVPLRERLPDIDPALDAIVMRCLSRDREERFANVAELAAALEPFGPPTGAALVEQIRGALSLPAPAPPTPPAVESPRRSPVVRASVPIVVALGALALFFGIWDSREPVRAALMPPVAHAFESAPETVRVAALREEAMLVPAQAASNVSARSAPASRVIAPERRSSPLSGAGSNAPPDSSASRPPLPVADPSLVLGGRH